ncbi:MAG TPA: PaaI family thioesterase [Acidimicrobiia bacterium]|nr:PaaI family thioesterase [Acidimicrobiia bacterium]
MTQLVTGEPGGARAAADFEAAGRGLLPGHLALEFDSVEPGEVRSRLAIGTRHMAPNGYLHAASVVALADTSCGYGTQVSLPEGAVGFTTIELKSNFLGTAGVGDDLICRAWMVHGGRTTQVWDAEVADGAGRRLALFRCSQMVLYPKAATNGPGAAA